MHSLDQDSFLALVNDNDNDADHIMVRLTKRNFDCQDMGEGMWYLIRAFGVSVYLRILCETWENWGPHLWRIDFRARIDKRFR